MKCMQSFQYMKCCNHEKREQLGLKNDWKSDDDDIHFSNTVGPSKQDFENQQNFARQWRKAAMKARKTMRKNKQKEKITKILFVSR